MYGFVIEGIEFITSSYEYRKMSYKRREIRQYLVKGLVKSYTTLGNFRQQ